MYIGVKMAFNSDFLEKLELMFKDKIEKQEALMHFGTCPSDFSLAKCGRLESDCIKCDAVIPVKA